MALLHILRKQYMFLLLVWKVAYSTDIFKMSGEVYSNYIFFNNVFYFYYVKQSMCSPNRNFNIKAK